MNKLIRSPLIILVILSALTITSISHVVLSTSLEPPEGLVSWWPGDGHADDIIGENHGELRNGPEYVEGLVDQAFSFNGVNSYVYTPRNGLETIQQVTIEAWVFHESLPHANIQRYVSLEYETRQETAVIRYDGDNGPGQLHFYLLIEEDPTDFAHIRVDNVLQEDIWHHVAGTYDGSIMRLFLDGTEIGLLEIPGHMSHGDNPFIWLSSPDESIDGLLDEPSVYNRALTPNEITSIYEAGTAGKRKPTPLVSTEVAVASTATAAVGIGAAGYYVTHQGASSVHVQQQMQQQQTQELQKQAKETERRLRRLRSRKQRPRVEWTITAPDLVATTTVNAVVSIHNTGNDPIQHITINAASARQVQFVEPTQKIDTLAPNNQHDARFTFRFDTSIRKGVYSLTFTLVGDSLPKEMKRHHFRVAKIGYLTSMSSSIQPWLTRQSYLTDVLANAGSRLRLLRNDIIIVPPGYQLSVKEAQNLGNYVEDGNALLMIGQPKGDNLQSLASALGYLDLDVLTVVDAEQSTLMFQRHHPLYSMISEGTPVVVLGRLQGSVCTSTRPTGQVLAEFQYAIASRQEQVPAIVTHQYGQGKTMHITLPLDPTMNNLSRVLANAITWLLSYPQVEN